MIVYLFRIKYSTPYCMVQEKISFTCVSSTQKPKLWIPTRLQKTFSQEN